MIVRVRLDVSEGQRRRVRAAQSRAGLATRGEIVTCLEDLWDVHMRGDPIPVAPSLPTKSVNGGTLAIRPDFPWPGIVTVRTARKRHKCEMPGSNPVIAEGPYREWDHGPMPDGHQPDIAPGTQCVENFGEAPLYQAGARYCAACAIAAGIAS